MGGKGLQIYQKVLIQKGMLYAIKKTLFISAKQGKLNAIN